MYVCVSVCVLEDESSWVSVDGHVSQKILTELLQYRVHSRSRCLKRIDGQQHRTYPCLLKAREVCSSIVNLVFVSSISCTYTVESREGFMSLGLWATVEPHPTNVSTAKPLVCRIECGQ